eukprot:868844-Amphidinium_carterae.1
MVWLQCWKGFCGEGFHTLELRLPLTFITFFSQYREQNWFLLETCFGSIASRRKEHIAEAQQQVTNATHTDKSIPYKDDQGQLHMLFMPSTTSTRTTTNEKDQNRNPGNAS